MDLVRSGDRATTERESKGIYSSDDPQEGAATMAAGALGSMAPPSFLPEMERLLDEVKDFSIRINLERSIAAIRLEAKPEDP